MKFRNIVFALCFIACLLISCADPVKTEQRPPIALLSLKIQPIEMINGMPENRPNVAAMVVDRIPAPIIETDWDDSYFNLSEADAEQLWFLLDAHVETARVVATATGDCRIQWGVGNSGKRPARFSGTGEPFTFGDNDFIYIMVSTRDEKYRSYYRIQARLASPVKLLSNLSIGEIGYDHEGKEIVINPRKAEYPDWIQPDDSIEGEISITLGEATDSKIVVVPAKFDVNSTLEYSTDGVSFTSNNNLSFNDNDVLYVKVIAQNQNDENIYKFRVSVGHIVTIAKLEMDTFEVSRMGVPSLVLGNHEDAFDAAVPGSFGTADQPAAGFSVRITLEDKDGDYEFGLLTNDSSGIDDVDWKGSNSTDKIIFNNKDKLAIKVNSATKNGIEPVTCMYYKIQVDLLAALINKQPQSAVYYIDSSSLPKPYYGPITSDPRSYIDVAGDYDFPVTPAVADLSVELDRTGTFTYQWYTANSWYGGYGFDEIGKIVGEDDCHVGIEPYSKYHPSTERGGFDEKNNVSLHNGGNQFYRLPISNEDAIIIPEGTGATYRPPVDLSRRPFLAGYSNQSQYYWVVITDEMGYQVTSERCVVITEWNEVWDLGRPTGTKVDKKHYIVDLHTIVPANQEGIHGSPMNPVPFTYKREKYIIPMTFPADFDIMDYSVCTAQARFYFRDGTPWIQNWTQGDLYFNENGVQQVGFYNLTNNNATLGLAGDSKEPQGADLLVTPDAVVIAPAGEKPVDEKPPFEADGVTPININDAQGWFNAYIELVELRFEGPARQR